VAQKADKDWQNLKDTGNSEYLKIKQVDAFGIKFGKMAIAIPLHDIDGKLWSYQKIYDDGKQPQHLGTRTKDFLELSTFGLQNHIFCFRVDNIR